MSPSVHITVLSYKAVYNSYNICLVT